MSSLPLFSNLPEPARRPGRHRVDPPPRPAAQPVFKKLWLSLWFPDLGIEALHNDMSVPAIATDIFSGRVQVAACNTGARDHGIEPGMPLSAARALCDDLLALPRRPSVERQVLEQLARRMLDVSSQVNLYAEDTLAVELRGSLRLFGGLKKLLQRIENILESTDFSYRLGVAPTARAAHWLALCRHNTVARTAAELKAALRPVPAAVLCDSEKQRRRLHRSGIKTLADVMRLPRSDAARRFGKTFYNPLDEALGARPETPEYFQTPDTFEAAHEFYQGVDNQAWIAEAFRGLLEKLERFLRRRQRALQHFRCKLYHERRPPTRIDVGTARPAGNAAHLLTLLNEHLDRTSLPAPVTHVAVEVTELLEPAVAGDDLFERTAARHQSWDELMDRLATRLGPEAIHRLVVRADHRPECADKAHTAAEAGNEEQPASARPLWLLEPSVKLHEREGRLYRYRQPLRLLPSVERIEQGWWDGGDVRRDYRVAVAGESRVWVFRDLRDGGWYLQGLFG